MLFHHTILSTNHDCFCCVIEWMNVGESTSDCSFIMFLSFCLCAPGDVIFEGPSALNEGLTNSGGAGGSRLVNCDCSKSILLILRPLLEGSVVIKIEFTTSHFQHDSGLKPEIHMMDNHGGSPEFHTCSGLAALDQTGQSFSHSLVIVVSCGK